MQHRFFEGNLPPKCEKQMLHAPALFPISSGESIPGELLLSRAHLRFDSIANFRTLNDINKLLKKAATLRPLVPRLSAIIFMSLSLSKSSAFIVFQNPEVSDFR